MIDMQVYSTGITLLCNHFNRELQPEVIRIWKEYLDAALTSEQFQQAVKTVLLENRFFPTAKELVEAVKGDGDSLALIEWEKCVQGSKRGDSEAAPSLSEQTKFALQSINGLQSLRYTEVSQLLWIKKEFVKAWKSWKPILSEQLSPVLKPESASNHYEYQSFEEYKEEQLAQIHQKAELLRQEKLSNLTQAKAGTHNGQL